MTRETAKKYWPFILMACLFGIAIIGKGVNAITPRFKAWLAERERTAQAKGMVKYWAEKCATNRDDNGYHVKYTGETEKDPWGNMIVIEYDAGLVFQDVTARSWGIDGTPKTGDDIHVTHSRIEVNITGKAKEEAKEAVSEFFKAEETPAETEIEEPATEASKSKWWQPWK